MRSMMGQNSPATSLYTPLLKSTTCASASHTSETSNTRSTVQWKTPAASKQHRRTNDGPCPEVARNARQGQLRYRRVAGWVAAGQALLDPYLGGDVLQGHPGERAEFALAVALQVNL